MKRLGSVFILAAVYLWVFCSDPISPWDDINNFAISVAYPDSATDGDQWRIGDTLPCEILLSFPNFAKSVTILLDSNEVDFFQINSDKSYDTISMSVVLTQVGLVKLNAVASLEDGSERTYKALVNVKGIPASLQSIAVDSLFAYAGESCTLSVVAEGSPGFTYSLLFEDTLVVEDTVASFVLDSLTSQDSGSYRIAVSNQWGSDTSEAILLNIVTLPIIATPENLRIAEQNDSFIKLTWSSAESVEKYAVYRAVHPDSGGELVGKAVDTFLVDTDPGDYYYWVEALVGDFASPRSTPVYSGSSNQPPSWTSATLSLSLREGDTANINLSDSSSDPNGDPLSFSLIEGDKGEVTDSMLTVVAQPGDSGDYSLTIDASDGALSAMVTVAIAITPRYFTIQRTAEHGSISLEPQKDAYRIGDTVAVTAEAATGFAFDGWNGDLSGTEVTQEFVILKDYAITARFVEQSVLTCIPLIPGDDINAEIRTIASGVRQGTLCLQPGLYNNDLIRVYGAPKVLIRK